MIALIVEAAVRSLALGVVVWLAMLALRPRNPHLQKTVWITVLVASIIMPFALKAQLAPSFDVTTYLVTLTPTHAANAAPTSSLQWTSQITIAYQLVSGALLLRFMIGLFAIWRIRRAAVRVPHPDGLDVRISPRIASPATFGSTILLPASSAEWSDTAFAAILSHERSHVRYRDCYVQWLARLHACIFWFNPMAWWLNRRLADLAETTSDDAVVETMSDRTAYADLLLEIARHPAPTLVTSAARSNISARIDRIISNIPPALPPRRWIRGVAVLALAPLFVLAAATAQSPATAPLKSPAAANAPVDSDDDPMRPRILYAGNHSDADYPAEAKRNGIEGYAFVNATLDAEGHVTYVQITEISPADTSYGFAESATRIAQTMRFSNPRNQPTQVKFKVAFQLKHPKQDPPPAAGALQ